ncbi:MAG: PIG-L family deacetylase [Anaerolineaceae bacterium]|nr:MAG: PIG-L family deacetylase [Anaerolineaceae bacterium]
MSKKILVVAAHPDDELLGPGGTVASHSSCGDQVTIAFIADADSARYDKVKMQTVRNDAIQAAQHLGVCDVQFAGLPDQGLDALPILKITQWIENVLRDTQPQIIYTHHFGDINRDHRVVYEAALTAARPYSAPYVERILCYETPSATEWAGSSVADAFAPNVFVDISQHLESKINAMSAYETEIRDFPHPRSLEAIRVRAATWGSVIGVTAAEAFVLVRETIR